VRITVIGCSGSFPGPDGPASCYLLEAEGFQLLLDLGSGAVGALQQHAALDDIDAVCLSHHHADHCLDICPFWVARTYDPHTRYPRIPVFGPEGTARRMAQAYGLDEDPGMTGAFDFMTLVPGKREIGPFQVTLAHMNHPVETFGFRVEHAGRALAYSADTGICPALVGLARQADVLLCEASYLSGPDPMPDMHLTARQAAEHAARAGTGQLILTHLVPWNHQERTLAEACEFSSFGGPISLAAPGRIIDVG
jgi:ribonuclease BN (tRNA processing enzyme)